MSYKTYKRNIYIIITFYIVILLSNIIEVTLDHSNGPSIISIVNYFAYRILSAYLVCFSIYAYITDAKFVGKLENPLIFIVAGGVLVILSFGGPILRYLSMPDTIAEVFSKEELEEMRIKITDKDITTGRKNDIARTYYLYTGESLAYLNDANHEVTYIPDEKTKELQEQLMKSKRQLQLTRANSKIIVFSLIVILVISCSLLLLSLWYKLRWGHREGT